MSSGNAGVLFLFCVLRQFVKHQHLQLLLASGGQNMTESWCKEGEIISILCYRINYTRKAPWKRDKFLNTYEGRDLLLMVGYKSTSDWLGYTSIMRQVQCCILHLLLDILNVLCFGLFSWETSLLSLNLKVWMLLELPLLTYKPPIDFGINSTWKFTTAVDFPGAI